MNIKKIIDERLQRVQLMIEASAQKIIKKELKKMQKDIIKGMVRK